MDIGKFFLSSRHYSFTSRDLLQKAPFCPSLPVFRVEPGLNCALSQAFLISFLVDKVVRDNVDK